MAISLKRPINIVECDVPFEDIDISFLFEIDDVMVIPVRHRFFDSKETGCIMFGDGELKLERHGAVSNVRPILFFDTKEPVPGEHDPILTIMVDEVAWPRRVFVRCNDCTMCHNLEDNICISCKCRLMDGDTTLFDIHRQCVSSELIKAVKSIIETIRDTWEAYQHQETAGAFDTLLKGMLGDDVAFETVANLPNVYKVLLKSPDVKETEELEETVPERTELPEGWYASEGKSNTTLLHFVHKGAKRYRTLSNLSEGEAEDILYALYDLMNGKTSNNRKANKIIKSLQSAEKYQDSLSTYSEMLTDTELELAAVKAELANTKEQLYRSQQQVAALSKTAKEVTGGISFNCPLDDLFPGEIMYQVMSSLKSHYDANYSDTDRTSRKAEVLKAVLDNTPYQDLRAIYKEGLYAAYYDKDVHRSKTLNDIRALGFDCTPPNGEGHVMIYPKGHPEYSYSLASTPSDSRSRDNEISRILRKLF